MHSLVRLLGFLIGFLTSLVVCFILFSSSWLFIAGTLPLGVCYIFGLSFVLPETHMIWCGVYLFIRLVADSFFNFNIILSKFVILYLIVCHRIVS